MDALRTVAIALVVACGLTTAAPAVAASKPGPMLLVPAVKAIHSGQPTWVKAHWGTTADICDAKVTVHIDHATVLYPSNTGAYTSFYRDDTLETGATDYTAFRLTTAAAHTLIRSMHLTVSYRSKTGYGCGGRTMSRTFYATVAVRAN